MTEKEKAGESEESTQISDDAFDRTKMDINSGTQPTHDQTHTQIRIDSTQFIDIGSTEDKKDSPSEKESGSRTSARANPLAVHWSRLKGKFPSLEGMKKKLMIFFSRFKNRPPSPSPSPKSRFLFSKDVFKYLPVNVLVIFAGIALHGLLLQSALQAFKQDLSGRWVIAGALLLSAFVSLFLAFKRKSVPWVAGIPLIILLALLNAHLFFFSMTDGSFMTIVKMAPAFLLNHLWIGLLGLEALIILLAYPRSKPLKAVLLVLIFFCILGFAINRIHGISLEAAWMGVGFLSRLPWFAQPVTLCFHVILPVLLLFTLGYWVILRRRAPHPRWIAFNVLILVTASAFGFHLLYRNRVPSIVNRISPPPLQVGSADFESDDHQISLRTVTFEDRHHSDRVPRYLFRLEKNPAGKELFLTASDRKGLPLLFLNKDELKLTVDGKILSNWKIAPRFPQKTSPFPNYVLDLPSLQPWPHLEIILPDGVIEKKRGEPLELGLSDPDVKIERLQVALDGASFQEIRKVGDPVSIPTNKMSPGVHQLEINLTAEGGQTATVRKEIRIQGELPLFLISPMDGDSFDQALSVALNIPSSAGVIQEYALRFDGQEAGRLNSYPYQSTIETAGLASGTHELTVHPLSRDGTVISEPTARAKVVKGVHPEISFSRPTMGEYVALDSTVELMSFPEGASFSSVELLLDEKSIHQWSGPPFTFPLAGLSVGNETILRVRAKTADGIQVSDWVRVMAGEGSFQIIPPELRVSDNQMDRTGTPFRYEKVVLVVDGSLSQIDAWGKGSKWQAIKKNLVSAPVADRLEGTLVGLVLAGGSSEGVRQKGCRDVSWPVPLSRFDPAKVHGALARKEPAGMFGLAHALAAALEKSPQKIIVLTDGIGSCDGDDLSKKMKESGAIIDVIAMGDIPEKDVSLLRKVAGSHHGRYEPVHNPEGLEWALQDLLTLNYRLLRGDEVVHSGPIDGQAQKIRAGEYRLIIPTAPPVIRDGVTVQHGSATSIKLVKEGNGIKIDK